jgi:tripeptide aminopeptidase
VLATFLELVAVDGPAGQEREIGDVLEARCAALGCSGLRDDVRNLVAIYPGNVDGALLVSTHMDTASTDTGGS